MNMEFSLAIERDDKSTMYVVGLLWFSDVHIWHFHLVYKSTVSQPEVISDVPHNLGCRDEIKTMLTILIKANDAQDSGLQKQKGMKYLFVIIKQLSKSRDILFFMMQIHTTWNMHIMYPWPK